MNIFGDKKFGHVLFENHSFLSRLDRLKQLETSFPDACHIWELLWKAFVLVEHVIVTTEMTLTDRETDVRVSHT